MIRFGVSGRRRAAQSPPPVPWVVRLEISPTTFDLTVSETVQMTPTVYAMVSAGSPETVVTGRTVTWATSNAAVATVDSAGLVTGVGAGSVTISAVCEGVPSSTNAVLNVSPTAVDHVDVSTTVLTVVEGADVFFDVTPEDASNNALVGRTVTASEVSGAGDVTLSVDNGVEPRRVTVTGVTAGTRVIKATCETIDSSNITVTVNAAAGGGDLPSGFDPAARGANLLHSTPWHEMTIGADAGHADLLANSAGAGVSDGSGGWTGQLVTDPHGDFATVWRVRNMPVPPWTGGQSTIQRAVSFSAAEDFWASVVWMMDGNGNANGNQPTAGGPYSEWFTSFGSGTPGGSTTYKLIFAFPSPNRFGSRMELELLNNGNFQMGVGHLEPSVNGLAQAGTTNTVTLPANASSNNFAFPNRVITITSGTGSGQSRTIASGGYNGSTKVATVTSNWTTIPDTTSVVSIQKTETLLTQGGAPVPPFSASLSCSAKNAADAAHDMRGTQDWYHVVLNKFRVSDSEYVQRYFIKRLTVAGVWGPWTNYVWRGWRITNGVNLPYGIVNFTGNKSQSNDGPNEQWLHGACLEVNNAADPWGLANYGL